MGTHGDSDYDEKRVKKLYATLLSAFAIGMLAATVWILGFEGLPPALAQTNNPGDGHADTNRPASGG